MNLPILRNVLHEEIQPGLRERTEDRPEIREARREKRIDRRDRFF